MHCQSGQMERAVEKSGGVGKKMSRHVARIKIVEWKTRNVEAHGGRQNQVAEHHDQMHEEMKKLEVKTSEEALPLVQKKTRFLEIAWIRKLEKDAEGGGLAEFSPLSRAYRRWITWRKWVWSLRERVRMYKRWCMRLQGRRRKVVRRTCMEAGARRGNGGAPGSLQMRSKAPTWTPIVKAIMDEGKSQKSQKSKWRVRWKVKKLRVRREKRDARLRKKSTEHGSGRSGRAELRVECDQRSAKDVISLRQSTQRKNSLLLAVDVRGDQGRWGIIQRCHNEFLKANW